MKRKGCRICDIVHGDVRSTPIEYSDELCIIFKDFHQDRAQAHYLCVPLRHIRDFKQLKIDDTNDDKLSVDLLLLHHMERVGLQFLIENLTSEMNRDNIRIGFH